MNLLQLIKLLFGPKALSKTLGTRTNVIRLPDNKLKRYIKEDLNIEAASDDLAKKAYKDMQELVAEVPKMNDAEKLIFEGNLRRLKNKLKIKDPSDPTAEVIEFGTKEKVSPKGIETLVEQAGQKSPPGTLMGDLESRINKLKASGKELEDIVKDMAPKDPYADIRRIIENPTPEEAAIKAKEKARLSKVFEDAMKMQKSMSSMKDEGLVRAAVRYKMMDDLKKGILKLPKNLEDVVRGASNEEEVITIFRNNYGEDALEQVDSLIPDFYNMSSATEAVKKIEQKFPNMKPKKIEVKQTMDLDEAAKAEQENILTPGKKYKFTGEESMKDLYKLEEKGIITRDDMNVYSPRYIEWLDAQIVNKEKLYTPKEWEKTPEVLKNKMRGRIDPDWEVANFGEDFDWDKARALEIDETQKLTPKKPEEPEDFATGGRVGFNKGSTGLDYLMGIERRGYAEGTDPTTEALKLLLLQNSGGGSDSGPTFTTPTKEEAEYAQEQGMQDVGENRFRGLGSMAVGALFSAINPFLGMAYSLADPNSMTRQVLSKIGFNPTTEGSISFTDGPFGGYNGFDGTEGTFSTDTSDTGASQANQNSVDTAAQDADQSGGPASSTSGADPAGDGGDGYATGGLVNRTGFKFGTKFGRFWKIARKVWDDINPTGDRKYDAQLVADELADRIFNKFMDELPQNVQIDLYALAYNNAPKVDALFRNPQNLSEAAKKGMAASKEMESLGLDVTKNSDFFKYEEMKLSGQLGPEHQVQAYKDKIRDEFYGVIDDTLMKQVEVDDNPQRLAEVYASIKEGLEMQKRGMTPEEIVRIMKQTPRTKNSQGGLNYLMGY